MPRIILTIIVLLISFSAQAQWDIGRGAESYQWTEYPEAFNGTPKENGFREALFVKWIQESERRWLFAWQAKIYAGTVDYNTYQLFPPNQPVSTKTGYIGAISEGQMIYHTDDLDFLTGIGLDFWNRDIGNNNSQNEDYSIYYIRAGFGIIKSIKHEGFHGQLGIKYPIFTNENAHLDKMGATSNPALSPKGALSGYAEFGYQINPIFDVLIYYDSWRFKQSDYVVVTDTSSNIYYFYQPKSNMDALGLKLLISF